MNRQQLLELWNDQMAEGNWTPSWPDSLASLTVDEALFTPDPRCRCLWQEVVHVIFWRQVTLDGLKGLARPTEEEVEAREFARPETPDADAWAKTVTELRASHDALAAVIADESKDVHRIPYHLIHDAYHLGRVTQLRAMQGIAPKF
jgi:hypothetical protein